MVEIINKWYIYIGVIFLIVAEYMNNKQIPPKNQEFPKNDL